MKHIVRATTFNVAEFDKVYKRTVDADAFVKYKTKCREDFLLLQEANRINNVAESSKSPHVRYVVVPAPRGLSIIYNSLRFSPVGGVYLGRMTARTGSRQLMCQHFQDNQTGEVYQIVNVHAGHNSSTEGKKQARQDLINFQNRTMLRNTTMTITGGDFNEMTKFVDKYTIGSGIRHERTHSMGNNDKIGVIFHHKLYRHWSRVLGNFGSDHNAVNIRVVV